MFKGALRSCYVRRRWGTALWNCDSFTQFRVHLWTGQVKLCVLPVLLHNTHSPSLLWERKPLIFPHMCPRQSPGGPTRAPDTLGWLHHTHSQSLDCTSHDALWGMIDGSLLLSDVSWSLHPLREATTANAFFIGCLSATALHSQIITTPHRDAQLGGK